MSDIKILGYAIEIKIREPFAKNKIDNKYRYALTKIWGDGKYIVAILINPSKVGFVKVDNTVNNITKYCYDNKFGSLIILNLFCFYGY